MVKPVGLSSGRGVHLATKEEFATEGHIVGISDILVEERVIVHPDLQKLNPDSCNTIRVYTLVDKDSNISIIGSYLKVGGGNGICDNFHNKGIMYCVDPKYGVITHPGLDFALRNHVIHPNTEYIMPGRQIPMWNEVLDCAIKAQKQNMKSRFIAWDIAITDNGCEIIEGNYNPNCNLLQIFDKEGKYHEILSRY